MCFYLNKIFLNKKLEKWIGNNNKIFRAGIQCRIIDLIYIFLKYFMYGILEEVRQFIQISDFLSNSFF